MGLFSPSATFTIGDEPFDDVATDVDEEASDREESSSSPDPGQGAPPEPTRLDPDQTRALLIEARDRARGQPIRRRKLAREETTRCSAPALVACGAVVVVALVGVAVGSRFAHRHASLAAAGGAQAVRGRSRPHDRRGRSTRRRRHWPNDRAAATGAAAPVAPQADAAPSPTSGPIRRVPASPTPTPTRPLPPTPPGGEFIIGGP